MSSSTAWAQPPSPDSKLSKWGKARRSGSAATVREDGLSALRSGSATLPMRIE
jgi:hypothetical protein